MKKLLFSLFFLSLLTLTFFLYSDSQHKEDEVKGLNTISFETEPTISITPELNITRFLPYKISSNDIPGTPQSVFIELWGKNGNGNTTCWDYYADGTCGSSNIVKNMSYEGGEWITGNIYPDSIYPEIYFANSSITWNNTPLATIVRRNDYHILHFNNPFTMVGEMYLYIEFNAVPVSTVNSSDLQVYLVKKGLDVTKFNSSWIGTDGVELVGTFTKNSTYHHTHTSNSSHKLVPLATNSDGTVGNNNIDVSGDFWVVLYSQSPNNSRGWNLMYHPSSLCNNENRWYRGNISGWTATAQEGCPDSHVHVVRKNADYMDGIEMVLTADYENESAISEPVSFYFGEIPNSPPVSTSFTSPVVGSTYSGDIEISWDKSSDINGDPIKYNIYLKQGSTTISTLASQISENIITSFDTSSVSDGNYTLMGEACDSINPCTPFYLDGNFTIGNTIPIQSISSISLSTSNSIGTYAKAGDTVTLTFQTTGLISSPSIGIYSGGDLPQGEISHINEGNLWEYSYTVSDSDSDGYVTFTISSDTLDKDYYETTNSSSVYIDNTAPEDPVFSATSGTYSITTPPVISLFSEGATQIRYTIDGSTPSCTSGSIYSNSINLTSNTTIKAVACDLVGNISRLVSSQYILKENLTDISIYSSNLNNVFAKNGDVIYLRFLCSDEISTPNIQLYVGEEELEGEVLVQDMGSNVWLASYIVRDGNNSDIVSFNISSDDLYKVFSETTDESAVYLDTIPPLKPTSNIPPGIFDSPLSVSLVSLDSLYTRYTLDGSIPSCTNGFVYLAPFTLTSSTTMKAVGCDQAKNESEIASFEYLFVGTNLNPLVDDQKGSENTQEHEEDALLEKEESAITILPPEDRDNVGIPNVSDNDVDEGRYVTRIIRRGEEVYISELRVKLVHLENGDVSNVSVLLHSYPKESITDDNGIALFEEVEVGDHTVLVKLGSREYRKNVNIERPDINKESLELDLVVLEVGGYEEFNWKCWLIVCGGLLLTILFMYSISKLRKNK